MATTGVPQDGWMSQLAALFGNGDDGTGMTTPTATNTNLATWQPPGVGNAGVVGQTGGTQFGLNTQTGGLALQGLSSLAGLWNSFNQQKMAKEQFNFQKDFANTNLNNSIKSYNNSLEDKLNSRGVAEGTSSADVQAQINARRLTR